MTVQGSMGHRVDRDSLDLRFNVARSENPRGDAGVSGGAMEKRYVGRQAGSKRFAPQADSTLVYECMVAFPPGVALAAVEMRGPSPRHHRGF
jgi:hypothetical protein